MTKQETRLRLEQLFLSVCQLQEETVNFDTNQLLIENGVNSIVALELLLGIEDEFSLEIDDEDLNSSLLNDIAFLTEYVYERIV